MTTSRIPYPECIRGLAALIVFCYHFALIFFPALVSGYPEHSFSPSEITLAGSPLNVLWNGGFAVAVFFVLSGFVLSLGFFSDPGYLLAPQVVRRPLRLMLPVLGSVLLAGLLLKLGLFFNREAAEWVKYPAWLQQLWPDHASFSGCFAEGTYGALILGETPKYNPVLWTMNMELYGSFLVFAFLSMAGRTRHRFVFYFLFSVLLWKSMLVAFIWGMALADLRSSAGRLKIHELPALLLVLAGLYSGSYRDEGPAPAWNWLNNASWKPTTMQVYMIGAVLLLAGFAYSRFLQRLTRHRFFLCLGRISFSFYLLHLLFLGTAGCGLFLLLAGNGISYLVSAALVFVVSLGSLWGLSAAYERWVDRPAIRLTKIIYEKWFHPAGEKDAGRGRNRPQQQRTHREYSKNRQLPAN